MSEQDFRPDKLLCIVAHADDIEFCAGGSLANWISQGTEVHYVICTNGANGSADREKQPDEVVAARRKEQQAAANVLGVASLTHLDYQDSFVRDTADLQKDIVREIRRHKPDTVFTMDPSFYYSLKHNYINHKDHRAVGQAVFDAVYPLARDHGSFPDLLADGLEPHKVRTLLLCNLEKSNFYVDIKDTFETKLKALLCHESQVPEDKDGVRRFFTKIANRCGEECELEMSENFIKLDTFA